LRPVRAPTAIGWPAYGVSPFRHKLIVAGVWVALAGVLAVLFPQLETVVRQQPMNRPPRDTQLLQTVNSMGAGFGEKRSKTTTALGQSGCRCRS
jgi:uncharacterized membrane protein YdfJ with MMPL/SSD domain